MSKMKSAIDKIETHDKSVEMLERLIRNAPYRVILRRDKDGKITGLCENSFSMSWEPNRIYIYWSGKAYSNFGTTHQLEAISEAQANKDKYYQDAEIYDPFSDDCPIEIDWNRWLTATSKYDSRNAHFTTI